MKRELKRFWTVLGVWVFLASTSLGIPHFSIGICSMLKPSCRLWVRGRGSRHNPTTEYAHASQNSP